MDTSSRWVEPAARVPLSRLNDYVNNDLGRRSRATASRGCSRSMRRRTAASPTRTSSTGCRSTSSCRRPIWLGATISSRPGSTSTSNYPIRDTDHYIEVCKVIQEKAGIAVSDRGLRQDLGLRRHPAERLDPLAVDRGQRLPERRLDQEQGPLGGLEAGLPVLRRRVPQAPAVLAQLAAEHRRGDGRPVHPRPQEHRALRLLNRGTLLTASPSRWQTAPDVWGPHFPITGGTSGSQCFIGPTRSTSSARKGPDAEIKQQAVLGVHQGVVPAREHDRGRQELGPAARAAISGTQLKGEPDRCGRGGDRRRIGDKPGMWTGHARSVDFQYNLLAPHGQRMLQGEPVAGRARRLRRRGRQGARRADAESGHGTDDRGPGGAGRPVSRLRGRAEAPRRSPRTAG